MPTPRAGFSTGVVDGKIYAIGGTLDSDLVGLSGVEEYNPATDTWTKKADMPTPRSSFSTSVVDRRVYVIGGIPGKKSGGLSTVEVYNPAADN